MDCLSDLSWEQKYNQYIIFIPIWQFYFKKGQLETAAVKQQTAWL